MRALNDTPIVTIGGTRQAERHTQALLSNYEATEADMYDFAVARPLGEKIQRAIALLQEWERAALKLSPDGYYLAFSGGKDSVVIKELARLAGVKFDSWYNLTTIDPPELVRFIKQHHADVRWNRPEKPMLKMMADKSSCGPPTRLARWCCDTYKEQGGKGRVQVLGVRGPESHRRKALWREFQPHRRAYGAILCPIVYWTEADVWEFIRQHSLPYCPLYDEGFRRLGCVGCPLGGPDSQAAQFRRWPQYERMWRKAFDQFWAQWSGVPTRKGERRWFEDFGSAQGLWDWWVSGKAAEGDGSDCQQMWMDL